MRKRCISVVIPARNERRWIMHTLDHVLHAAQRIGDYECEIIVVDNASSDGTWEALQEYAQGRSIRAHQLGCLGAARARNFGRQQASGRILVFLDADTHIPADALARVIEHCETRGMEGGISRLQGMDRGIRSLLWWSFWEHVRRLPLPRAKAMPAFMFCTAEAFDEFGPFDEEVAIGEEWPILSGLFQRRPQRFVYDRSLCVRTSDRRMKQQAFGYSRTLFKYVWAILHRSGRIHYSDRYR